MRTIRNILIVGLFATTAQADVTRSNAHYKGTVKVDGSIGVGSNASQGKLHVSDAYSVTLGPSTNSALIVSDTASNLGMALISSDADRGFIEFRDQTARRFLISADADDSFVIEEGSGTARLKINATGGVEVGGTIKAGAGFTGNTGGAGVRFYSWIGIYSGGLSAGNRISTHGTFGALNDLGTGAYRQTVSGMCTGNAICTANNLVNDGSTACKIISSTATTSEVRCKNTSTGASVHSNVAVTCMCQ